MESFDSSPNYMRAKSSYDAKKENSPQGGGECDEIMSVSSSTCGSAINGPYAPKLANNGIKYRTSNKKTLKNFGNVRSFRRRAKSRVITSAVPMSDEDSLVDSSEASPRYLKATTCSQGKKTSPRHSESPVDSLPKSASPSHKSFQTLSRTSGLRSVRILVKKTSFKPKRSSLSYSKVSEDVSVDRATYSSTIKDSKFPVPVELHPGGTDSENSSSMKVCRYHHCSLHGHCHGSDDPVPPPKRFLYKRRRSLKKQKSMIPKTELRSGGKNSSVKTKNLQKNQIAFNQGLFNQERISDSMTFSGVENKNGVDSQEENYPNQDAQLFGNGYNDNQESYLVELAFGETSFPERSYEENLNILRKYSSQEQDFGGTSFGRNGYCSRCSCRNTEEVTSTPRRADADFSEVTSSNLNGYDNEIPQNGSSTDVSGTSSSAQFKNPNEASDKSRPHTPVVFDQVTEKNNVFSPASYSQTSNDSNSEEEAEITAESATTGDPKANEVVQVEDSETNSPVQKAGKLQFSKPRHISMWHLIQQHMSSNLAAEPTNKPLQGADGESPAEGANSPVAKEKTSLSRELSNSDMGGINDDSETQEIEIRKLFAIKLVRQAIEKILLPEVQDQTLDDQSVTSESTPQSELMEENQSKACAQKNYAESDAERGEANASSNPKEESVIADDASGREIRETEKQVVRKSENKAPKHWSNLKKWILLQRFIRELEKVKRFNPRKPQILPLNPDPEAEKVNLRPQTVDGRKRSEEWMLDYALRQAVSQLAPTQKKKVSLLVKAFETVVPPQEDSQVQFRIPRLRDIGLDVDSSSNKADESVSEGHGRNEEEAPINKKVVLASDDSVSILVSANRETGIKMMKESEKVSDGNDNYGESSVKFQSLTGERSEESTANEKCDNGKLVETENTLPPSFHPDAVNLGKVMANEIERQPMPILQGLQGDAISEYIDEKVKDSGQYNQMDRKNYITTWHMIYQHVVSGIAEKVGSQLLGGAEDDEVEGNGDSQPTDGSNKENHTSSNLRSGLTKSDALKLVKEAVDEILLPEIQDDSSDTQSVTSESIPEDVSERNSSEIGGENISSEGRNLMSEEGKDTKAESQVIKKSELPKPKNWSKLKKLILLKRSIKALEKARKFRPQPSQLSPQTPDPEPEKVELRRQMMDERKKAEQWMLDYAVQHIVTKLTPARKRRVSMLVEAFEAVVPLPEL